MFKLYTTFNNKLALKITAFIGSMTCAYLFALIALISLPAAILTGSVIIIVAWLAQTFLQLVLLSIIMVGQNLQSEQSQRHMEKILHAILKDEEKELKYIQKGEL